ncbi:hypothetical protein PVA17_09225 [Lysinibacillus sp. CNPSo 3705]|uniref:hypothetical protein n=1 Tax=Lysinibacillus sp. CNPSo 3705 TaxID=3028148 RepID=UPI002363C44D|nr:hypothetical protein [Lysinibacillus sp. CNPSo 3705]MDD1502938.1 hypothetical protein [Lysinibacillus sp. CNPSo 3705]
MSISEGVFLIEELSSKNVMSCGDQAKRQQHGFICAKAKRQQQQQQQRLSDLNEA